MFIIRKIVMAAVLLLLGGVMSGDLRIARAPESRTTGAVFMEGRNRLGDEKSPYLLQHKDNPVHWYAWGDDAFAAARAQNKLVFLSIGYSTCHWCHVMEHDSFERQDVADLLNKDFISMKVDREERPDVDQIYMDAVVGLTGHGGWPMSVFLTPDRKPFYGGTFFWRAQFMQLLRSIQETWDATPAKITAQSAHIAMVLQQQADQSAQETTLSTKQLQQFLQLSEQQFDATHGGFGEAPKFPPSTRLRMLLRIYRRTGHAHALKMVTTTLDHMARGGMYDHLGGGFARYATDVDWMTPHFEKMLYDNALLATTYLEAYQVTKNNMYASVAREILDYVLRDMTHPDGGFYSAEDADSEGEEGKFYVWQYSELQHSLRSEAFDLFQKVYGVSAKGNFEHNTNILSLTDKHDWSIKSDPLLQSAHKKLFTLREARIHPHKDDKILTAWNGLMISAMAKGYQVLGDDRYRAAAQHSAQFIKRRLTKKDTLLRRYRDGEARFAGTLNDYAYLIAGLLDLYQSDFDVAWVTWATTLQTQQDDHFWDQQRAGYFVAAEGTSDLVVRNKEVHDGAIPSGNGVTALNLLRLYALTFHPIYHERSEALLAFLSGFVAKYPPGYAQAMLAIDYHLDRAKEVAIVGSLQDPATQTIRDFVYQEFLPNMVLAIGATDAVPLLQDRPQVDHQTTFYICEGNLCQAPTIDANEAMRSIAAIERY